MDNALITKILQLADSCDSNNNKLSNLLLKEIFPNHICADESVIPEVIPILVKFLPVKDENVQENVLKILVNLTAKSSAKTNAELMKNAGAIAPLVKLLESTSSNESEIFIATLNCLDVVANYFPEEVIKNGALSITIHRLLILDCHKVLSKSLQFLANILLKNEQNAVYVINNEGIETLICMLHIKDRDVRKQALFAISNLIYYNVETIQLLLDHHDDNFISFIKSFLKPDAFFRLPMTTFIKNFSSFGVTEHINMVIKENFIPIIVKQIKFSSEEKLKYESIKVIKNIIKFRPEYVKILINWRIISLLVGNFDCNSAELLIAVLSLLKSVINDVGYQTVKRIFERCNGIEKLKISCEHENKKVKRLADSIDKLIEKNVKRRAKKIPKDCSSVEVGTERLEDVLQNNPRKRKRPLNPAEQEEEEPKSTRSEIVKDIINLANGDNEQQLQACGKFKIFITETEALFQEDGGLQMLVDFLSSTNKEMIKLCLKFLSNLSNSHLAEFSKLNAISPLLDIIKSNIPVISLKAACVFKNLSHNKANILLELLMPDQFSY